MRKNLLKRYNDFIKINENQETEAPVKPETAPTETPTPTETPDKRRRERYTTTIPVHNPDPLAETEEDFDDIETGEEEEGVEDNLESPEFIRLRRFKKLHDTLEGSELMNNILKYKGHEITLPSETGEFEVDGVRNIKQDGGKLVPTSSVGDVIEYLNNPEAQREAQAKQDRRLQAQAQRAQAQVQKQSESVDYTMGRTENQLPNPPEEINLNIEDEEENFETQTGGHPEEEAKRGIPVDVKKTGKLHQGQVQESKSYRNRFRTKL